ncbi:hypothetical protein J6G99_07790 [bacterium]|nr:hypothetical protein [bacterium]
MITLNPVKISRIPVSFGNNKNNDSKIGLMALDKNSKNKINFEKDLFITKNADPVQSNPLKAIGYSIIKAYNILSTPKRNTESNYVHLPYMA